MAALLFRPGVQWDGVGVAAAMGGALSMAAGTFLASKWKSEMPVLAFTGWQLLLGGAILLPFALALDPPLPSLTGTQLLGYAYISIAGALLAYLLWFRGISRLPPVAMSSLGLLSPVVAVLAGWLVLSQSVQGLSLAGLVVVLLSIGIVQWAGSSSPFKAR